VKGGLSAPDELCAAEREFVLDQILTDL